MFRHNFDKQMPWHFMVEIEKLIKCSKSITMLKPVLSPFDMAQGALFVTFSLYLLINKSWVAIGN